MSDSTFGRIFRITTWGESHGAAIGAVIDGCPAGLILSEDDIQRALDRRRPGQSAYTTKRNESDTCHILSGVFNGVTTGTPISVLVKNEDQHSKDYSNIANVYRPGHADFPYQAKYGIRDYRGGGRSSARETIGRVIGGAIAEKLLAEFGIQIHAYATQIGPVGIEGQAFDLSKIESNPLRMPITDTSKAEQYLLDCIEKGDSAGGIMEVRVDGCPAGLGSPVFGKLDALLSQAIMSIGAVKGVEIGDGFKAAAAKGSENNDAFFRDKDGKVRTKTNHAGGILGGMSNGAPIVLRAAVKPTPSISIPQETVDTDGKETAITIKGRHDPCIVPRAVVVAEAMAALTIADALLLNSVSKLSTLKNIL